MANRSKTEPYHAMVERILEFAHLGYRGDIVRDTDKIRRKAIYHLHWEMNKIAGHRANCKKPSKIASHTHRIEHLQSVVDNIDMELLLYG